ncbi:MAG: DUF1735 domain-containing protein [Proteiniphilum sp.]|jgi:hypothetical protein|nr:DUF1735 domain-containing protein [Proteiniphilum sp.]
MNNSAKYICVLLMLPALLMLGGCEENIHDFKKPYGSEASAKVYIDAKDLIREHTVTHTINSGSDTLLVKFPVYSTAPVASRTKVRLIIDAELQNLYNQENETHYILLPEEVLATRLTVWIPEGETESEDSVTVAYANPMSRLNGISSDGTGQMEYLLPIRILKVSGADAGIKYDSRTSYVKVSVRQEDGVKVTSPAVFFRNTPIFNLFTDIGKIPFTVSTCHMNVTEPVKVRMELNNNLIAAYNEANGTNYRPLPGNVTPIDLEIEEGRNNVSAMLNYAGDIAALTDRNGYLIPLEIRSSDISVSEKEKVFYTVILVDNATIIPDEQVTVSMKTDAALSDEYAAELGVQQTDRSGYSVGVRNMVTDLEQPPYSSGYPAKNMITDGSGTALFNSSSSLVMNVIIDLGKDTENITGFRLEGYSATGCAKSYDVCYATEAMYLNREESWTGTIDDCLRYVYVKMSEPVKARYIILRNVKPTLPSGYIGWKEFYLYCNE